MGQGACPIGARASASANLPSSPRLLTAHATAPLQDRANLIALAKPQIDYALGSTGRSYLSGWGTNGPRNPHHAAASCPVDGTCGWSVFNAVTDNANVRPIGGSAAGWEAWVVVPAAGGRLPLRQRCPH